ncbi:MAG: hypothetical protein EPN30_03965 [Actinomycetota bacterium]|nr:MAG: hypothetical protein EPN30_03965 [Actinomycetota bacterium]
MTPNLDAPSDEFEHAFARVLDLAEKNVWAAHNRLIEVAEVGILSTSMPEVTVWRLHLGASANFSGVLQCLRTRASSLAALSLIRGLTESWTHLHFIADKAESGTPAQRAIRYEAGLYKEWQYTDMSARPSLDHQQTPSIDSSIIQQLWTQHGGGEKLAHRTYKHVPETWKKIKHPPKFEILKILHKSTSNAAHMNAVDFILSITDSQIRIEGVSDERRSAWLLTTIYCFDKLTLCALEAISKNTSEVARSLHSSWDEILDSPVLAKAIATMAKVEHGL